MTTPVVREIKRLSPHALRPAVVAAPVQLGGRVVALAPSAPRRG